MESRVGGRDWPGEGGGILDGVSPGGEDRNRNEKQEKAKAGGGKAILLALIDFWENNVISVSFSLYTHRAAHTLTGHVMGRANKSLWRSTCIPYLYFTSTKAPKHGSTADLAKPPRNRNTVKLCIQIGVSLLAVATPCRFIYIQPCTGAEIRHTAGSWK